MGGERCCSAVPSIAKIAIVPKHPWRFIDGHLMFCLARGFLKACLTQKGGCVEVVKAENLLAVMRAQNMTIHCSRQNCI